MLARTLLVERAVSLGETKETKTRRTRSVRILAPLERDLEDWRSASAADTLGHLVFPRRDWMPWSDHDYRNWRKRVFRPTASAAGLRLPRPYDLRHAFVSLMLAEGRNVLDVAGRAGHAPSLTYDVYGHLIADLDTSEQRSAEDIIFEAREAGVRHVCELLGRTPEEDTEAEAAASPFAGVTREALSGTRTLDPLLTIQIQAWNQRATTTPQVHPIPLLRPNDVPAGGPGRGRVWTG